MSARLGVLAIALVVMSASCAPQSPYAPSRSPSSCTTDADCPPLSTCNHNTCVKGFPGMRPPSEPLYGTYALPGQESELVVAITGPVRDAQTKVVLDMLNTELARYSQLRPRVGLDLSQQMEGAVGQATEMERMAQAIKAQSATRTSPPFVLKAMLSYLGGQDGQNPTLTLELISMQERRALSSTTKSFHSIENMKTSISTLVEDTLKKELEARDK